MRSTPWLRRYSKLIALPEVSRAPVPVPERRLIPSLPATGLKAALKQRGQSVVELKELQLEVWPESEAAESFSVCFYLMLKAFQASKAFFTT